MRRRPAAAADPAGGAAAAEARAAAHTQLKTFEQAVKLFHNRKFTEARELF